MVGFVKGEDNKYDKFFLLTFSNWIVLLVILILIVLPCFYLIMDDLKELIAKKVKINF